MQGHNFRADKADEKQALWRAICETSSRLSCEVFIGADTCSKLQRDTPLPNNLQTWKLVEALSILALLLKADHVYSTKVSNLLGKTGPIHFEENRNSRYLWSQPKMTGIQSDLGGRPDILITSSPDKIDSSTTLRIIECKCCKKLRTPDIRGEFGKALDLKVKAYFIWSFYTPSQSIIDGAKRLGLDVEVLGFDTPQRNLFIEKPENIMYHVANSLEVFSRSERFAQALLQHSNEMAGKFFLE